MLTRLENRCVVNTDSTADASFLFGGVHPYRRHLLTCSVALNQTLGLWISFLAGALYSHATLRGCGCWHRWDSSCFDVRLTE